MGGWPWDRNSVHKYPKMASRYHFRVFVYTVATRVAIRIATRAASDGTSASAAMACRRHLLAGPSRLVGKADSARVAPPLGWRLRRGVNPHEPLKSPDSWRGRSSSHCHSALDVPLRYARCHLAVWMALPLGPERTTTVRSPSSGSVSSALRRPRPRWPGTSGPAGVGALAGVRGRDRKRSLSGCQRPRNERTRWASDIAFPVQSIARSAHDS